MNNSEKTLFQIERSPSGIKWKNGQQEKIIELYKNGTSINQIRKMFGNIHYNTVKKILINNNIQLRTRAQSHYKDNRDENIFEKIDNEEKAYWLGFLAADGCVHGNYIKISLQEKDYNHLVKFRKFLKADSIKITSSFVKDKKGKNRKYYTFSIGCKKMANDLKKAGIVERKSLILMPPIIDKEYEMDWIRGFFDGDGGLSYSYKNNRWQSYANSTKEVLNWICEKLELNVKPFNQQHYGIKDNVWRLHFNGRNNVYNAWNKMMKNGKAKIYLDRKYNLYIKLCETYN